jgi:hypothetical protein
MRPDARESLAGLIDEYGKSIVRTPTSCRLYLAARLAAFPGERDLLAAALGLGIPERILQHAGTDAYEAELAGMARELSDAAGAEPPEAAEAVTAWAEALHRPVGYQKPAVPDRVYPAEGPDPAEERRVRRLMALIAAAGGFLGTALGAGAVVTVFAITDATVGGPRILRFQPTDAGARVLAVVVKVLVCGAAGGLAAAAGWAWGKGDERPWAGFAASFGAGLAMALLLLSYVWSAPRLLTVAGSVFGAAFTAASRGGYRT